MKVMAGIVLYNPDIDRLLDEINSVLPQVDFVCLFDNGSDNIGIVEEKTKEIENLKLLKSVCNLGIGTASNRLCKYAKENGFDWILMLDHDTICPANLIDTFKKYTNDKEIGMLCPNVVDKEIVNNIYISATGKEIEYINKCIQSATLVRLNAWEKCGGYNEWMFIDYVDFDFCKRLELNGLKIGRCTTVTVDHQLGKRIKSKYEKFYSSLYNRTRIKAFKYLVYKNVFSKARVYYCTRNNIVYIKMFRNYIDTGHEWRKFYFGILKRILRSTNRPMIICETIRGMRDGFKTTIQPYKIV